MKHRRPDGGLWGQRWNLVTFGGTRKVSSCLVLYCSRPFDVWWVIDELSIPPQDDDKKNWHLEQADNHWFICRGIGEMWFLTKWEPFEFQHALLILLHGWPHHAGLGSSTTVKLVGGSWLVFSCMEPESVESRKSSSAWLLFCQISQRSCQNYILGTQNVSRVKNEKREDGRKMCSLLHATWKE